MAANHTNEWTFYGRTAVDFFCEAKSNFVSELQDTRKKTFNFKKTKNKI